MLWVRERTVAKHQSMQVGNRARGVSGLLVIRGLGKDWASGGKPTGLLSCMPPWPASQCYESGTDSFHKLDTRIKEAERLNNGNIVTVLQVPTA